MQETIEHYIPFSHADRNLPDIVTDPLEQWFLTGGRDPLLSRGH